MGLFCFAGLLNKLLGLVPKAAAPATYLESTMGLLDQAHSFAQGASNGVASSLTGPVDGLAWLLRKAGVPVPQAPLGGSDWMRNVGLMQEPKERMAGLLGEGIGSALPTVIAGKAPQIANGLLQMERNAMAPRTLNPQTGAIVWHGSPHKFDKFDSSKIGTGEGAQAYGHGLYLAESDKVAKQYADTLTDTAPRYLDGVPADQLSTAQKSALGMLSEAGGNANAALLAAKTDMARSGGSGAEFHVERYNTLRDIARGKINAQVGEPSLYKVDLPDEQIAKMLDWDKPLSQQPKAVQAGLKQYLGPEWDKTWDSLQGVNAYDVLANGRHGNPTGSIEAAEKLRKAGIPGIRYLDGGSRTGGAGTSNYVVFPGNEGLLKILERNGQGLLGN